MMKKLSLVVLLVVLLGGVALAQEKPAPRPAAEAMQEIQASAKRLEAWPEVLQTLREYSQAVAASFSGSTAYVSGEYVLIDAPSPMAFELLRRPAQRDKMREAIRQVTGRVYKLGPYQKSAAQQEKKPEDPLEDLEELARGAGIEVIKK